MGTNYPAALDSITRPSGGQTLAAGQHSQRHDDESDAIEALEAKVGIDNSTNPNSIDKRVADLEGSVGFSGDATDVVVSPTGGIAATNAQTALAELDTEKIAYAETTITAMGFVVDEDDMVSDLDTKVPTQRSVKAYTDTHIATTPGAHAAAAVTYDPAVSGLSAIDVQSALDELHAESAAGGIPAALADAADDIVVASAADTWTNLTKGSNYTFLGVNGSGSVAYLDPRAVPQTVNTQTGTTYTLVLTDAGKLVTASNAANITLTVPPASSVAFPAGTVIDLAQYGAGQVTVAQGSGVTVNTSSTLKLRTQWSSASLVLSATADTWFLVGDLEPLGQAINAQTGTTYSLVIGDAWKLITLSNASAITLTIPANASVAFPIGTHIDLMQLGAGQVTTTITSDTLRSTPTAKLRAQYSMASLVKIASTTWVITGDLALT